MEKTKPSLSEVFSKFCVVGQKLDNEKDPAKFLNLQLEYDNLLYYMHDELGLLKGGDSSEMKRNTMHSEGAGSGA